MKISSTLLISTLCLYLLTGVAEGFSLRVRTTRDLVTPFAVPFTAWQSTTQTTTPKRRAPSCDSYYHSTSLCSTAHDSPEQPPPQDGNDDTPNQHKKPWGQRLQQYFAKPDDGLTFRQRLAKLGLAVVLSYGFVSNMSYCVSVSAAWYIFSKRVGLCVHVWMKKSAIVLA